MVDHDLPVEKGSATPQSPEPSLDTQSGVDPESNFAELSRSLRTHLRQIELSGGQIEQSRFITESGYLPLTSSRITPEGSSLIRELNVDGDAVESQQIAETLSRQTYLAFPDSPKPASAYLDRVVRGAGHRSVTAGSVVTSLFSGISIDAAIPLIAGGGSVARLTSSKTKAMDETAYRVSGEPEQREWQREFIKRFLELREEILTTSTPLELSENGREFFNMFNLSAKAISLFHTMNLKELHSLFNKTFRAEHPTRELPLLLAQAADNLAESYPGLIEPSEYYRFVSKDTEDRAALQHPSTKDALLQVVEESGGVTADGRFILRPGCALKSPPRELLTRVVSESGSEILPALPVQFQLSGVSYETVLELAAHKEAHIPWLPHNGLAYMNDPAYRVQGSPEEIAWQRSALDRFLELRESAASEIDLTNPSNRALFNGLQPGSRAVQVSFTMNLGDFHKLFIGRLSQHGNEQEIQEICRLMCQELHTLAPDLIHTPEKYYEMSNEAKYA